MVWFRESAIHWHRAAQPNKALLFLQVHDRRYVVKRGHEWPTAGTIWCDHSGWGSWENSGHRHPDGSTERSGSSEIRSEGIFFFSSPKWDVILMYLCLYKQVLPRLKKTKKNPPTNLADLKTRFNFYSEYLKHLVRKTKAGVPGELCFFLVASEVGCWI